MRRTIEQELALRGHGFFQTVGDSMEPLLHNRKSTVVIEIKKEPLKRFDVVLYKRPTGEYVLHRLIQIQNGICLIRGDNRIDTEQVPAAWILGSMSGFYADETDHYTSCGDKSYQRYVKTLWIRYIFLRLRCLIGRICRRIIFS